MRRHISAARVETAPILDEANRLMAQTATVANKQRLLALFNAHFLLSDAETLALTSAAEPVTDEFFQVLVKAKRIHRDSRLLLGGENQRLGLEILEQSSRQLTAAFHKLHRWVQREFKSLDLENPQIGGSIRRALRVLAERKVLFDGCLDAFAQARQRTLSDAFYAALTGGVAGAGGLDAQKPMEFSAHEPLRYIGDMLAWAHATTVSERENLETLFIYEGPEIAKGIQEGLESEPWRDTQAADEEPFDGRLALEQLVSRNMSGVAALVRQRIEQVILSHDEPVLAYKIANLVHFYRAIFAKLEARTHEQSSLIATLDALADAALHRFTATMRYAAATALSDNTHTRVGEDLAPPTLLTDALEILTALLATYDSSASLSDPSGANLLLLLTEALDPFLAACDDLASTIPTPSYSTIFSLNCLLAAHSTLSHHAASTGPKLASLDSSITSHAARLTESQHAFLLSTSGILPLISALDDHNLDAAHLDDDAILHTTPAFAPDALLAASRHLDAFLPHALVDAALNLRRLRDGGLARACTEGGARRFCADFERLEGVVVRAIGEEGGAGLRQWFPRTAEEIWILLS